MSSNSARPELRDRDLCFLDVETTGPIFGFHEIIDIGLVRTTPDGTITRAEWSCRIRPRHPERITPAARKINGFSEKEWENAEGSSKALWAKITDIAEGCVPVCHNPSFDRSFVTLTAYEAGIEDLKVDYHWIGTESLAWPLYVGGEVREFSLRGLCVHFGIPEESLPHTAIGGASTCRMVYCSLLELSGGLRSQIRRDAAVC